MGKKVFGGPVTLRRAGDAKSLYGVTVTGTAASDLKTLLSRLT